ncbi:MAG: TonB-dependent receptor [Agarilytica sp.]
MSSTSNAKKLFSPSLLAIAVAAITSGQTFAQDKDVDSARPATEEVIVTVERREQSIQDVAATVQSFSAEDLDTFGVNSDFRNLQNAVTGLHISNQEGKLEVFLRGVGNSDSDFASDPSVATHYNGIYLPRPRSIGPMFFDVERVEVNKGPQGTLRGRNATGGTINIISKRPDFDDGISGEVKVGVGSYNQRHFEGVLNLPVSDTLAFRASVYSEERDPYMKNAFTGSAEALDSLDGGADRIRDAFGGGIDAPGALDDQAIRLSAQWNPSEAFSAFFLADHVRQRGSGTPGAFSGRALSAGYDIDDLDDPYNQYFVNEGEMKNDITGISTNLVYDFGSVALEYSGAYREYDFQHRNAAREWQIGMDYPGAREEAEAVILGNEQTAYGNFTQGEVSQSKIHELRAFSNGDGPLQWTAGVFAMDENFSWASQDFNHGWWGDGDEGFVNGWLNGLSGENRNDDSTVESRAVFADGSFAVSDAVRIKAGLRWTRDKKVANEANANYQLILTDEALAALGLDGPQDIVMGTNGLQLTEAGDRPNNVVPLGNSAETRQYFLDGITQWGHLDNLDDLIAYDPDAFQVVIRSDFSGDIPNGNITQTPDSDPYTDWRLGVEIDVDDDHLVYGMISTGTRSGGINRPLPEGAGQGTEWEPEQLLSYEIGSKDTFELEGAPIRLNTALFFYDYNDKVLQGLVNVRLPCSSSESGVCDNNYIQNQNAAKASLIGAEVDGDISLPEGFKFSWNFAYLNSKFKESVVIDTRQAGQVEVDITDNMLPNTSKVNLNLALSQDIQLDWGVFDSADWSLSMNYRSKFYLSPFNNKGYDSDGNQADLSSMAINNHWLIAGAGFDEANGNFLSDEVPATTIFNLNMGVNLGNEDNYRLEGWVSNLTDETYSSKAFINDSVNIRFLNPPRMAGVRFKAKF